MVEDRMYLQQLTNYRLKVVHISFKLLLKSSKKEVANE